MSDHRFQSPDMGFSETPKRAGTCSSLYLPGFETVLTNAR